LIGNTDIEDSLEKLDKLTQEEARMASAEQLRIAHNVEGKVMDVDKKAQGIGDEVQNVGKKVEDVNDKVQGIDDGVKDVGDKVHTVDRKLDDTTRPSSLIAHPLIPNAQAYSQGTCSGTIFYDGFPLPIHP
jgi:hypothetical protein